MKIIYLFCILLISSLMVKGQVATESFGQKTLNEYLNAENKFKSACADIDLPVYDPDNVPYFNQADINTANDIIAYVNGLINGDQFKFADLLNIDEKLRRDIRNKTSKIEMTAGLIAGAVERQKRDKALGYNTLSKKDYERNKNISDATTTMGNVLLKGTASNKENNFYNRKSTHFGFNVGLCSPTLPIIINENFTSITGTTVNNSLVKSPANLGVALGLSFDPIMSNHFSIGLMANGYWAANYAQALFMGNTTSSDYGVTTDEVQSGYVLGGDVGANMTIGFKSVKLYFAYVLNYMSLSYSYNLHDGLVDLNGNPQNDYTQDNGSANYNSSRIEMGVRLGNYKKTTFDLIYGIEKFNNGDDQTYTNSLFKVVMWCPSVIKIYAEYGNWLAVPGNQLYPWKDGTDYNTTSAYINVGIVYNKDWFYRKKKAGN